MSRPSIAEATECARCSALCVYVFVHMCGGVRALVGRWEWGLGAGGKDTADPLDIFTLNSEAGGRAVDRGLLKASLAEHKLDTGLASVVMWSDLWGKTLELHERKVAAHALPGAALFAEGIPRSRASFAAFGTVKSSSMRDVSDPFAGIDDGDDANADEERVWPVQDCAAYAVLVEVELEAVMRRRLAAGKRAAKRRAEGALAVDAIDGRMRAGMYAALKPGGGGSGLLESAPPEVLAGCAHLDTLDHRGMCIVCGRFNPAKTAAKAHLPTPAVSAAAAGASVVAPPSPLRTHTDARHWLDLGVEEMQHRVLESGVVVTILEVPTSLGPAGSARPDGAAALLVNAWRARLIAAEHPLSPIADHAGPAALVGSGSTHSTRRLAITDLAVAPAQRPIGRSRSAPRKSVMSIASTAARGRSSRSILPSVRLATTAGPWSKLTVTATPAAAARAAHEWSVRDSLGRTAAPLGRSSSFGEPSNRRLRVAAMGPGRDAPAAAAPVAAHRVAGAAEDRPKAAPVAVVSAAPIQDWDGTDRRLTRHASMDADPARVSIVMPISAMTPSRVPQVRKERSFHSAPGRSVGFDAEALGLPSVRVWPRRSPDAVSILAGWLRVRTLPLSARVVEPVDSEQTRRFRALGFGGGEESSVDSVRRAVLAAASSSMRWTRLYGVLFSDAVLEYSLTSSEAECDGFIDIRTAVVVLQSRETYCPPHGIELGLPDRALMLVPEVSSDAPFWQEVLEEQVEMEHGSDDVLYASQLRKRGKVNVAWQSRFVTLERSGKVSGGGGVHFSSRTRARQLSPRGADGLCETEAR